MFNFIPAKILSYDAQQRTAQVQIEGLIDVAESFMTQLPYFTKYTNSRFWAIVDCSIHAPHSSVIKNRQVKELSFDSSFFIA